MSQNPKTVRSIKRAQIKTEGFLVGLQCYCNFSLEFRFGFWV